jgi:hypothetical protein
MSGLEPTVTVEGEATAAPPPAKSPLAPRDPKHVEYEIDSLGRRIGVRRLTALDMFELTILLAENSGNAAAIMQAMTASSVVSIDGDVVYRPANVLQLKARIQRLDFEGYQAAIAAVGRLNPDETASKDAIKN